MLRQSAAELLASPDLPHHCSAQLIPQLQETRKLLSLLLLLKPEQSLEVSVGPSGDPLRNLKQGVAEESHVILPRRWVVTPALDSTARISRASKPFPNPKEALASPDTHNFHSTTFPMQKAHNQDSVIICKTLICLGK